MGKPIGDGKRARKSWRSQFRRLSPNALLAWLLIGWWLLNVVFAAAVGLAADEAYYWIYAQHLDWGYYDHPPMVALLIWLTDWLPGELGVRLAATLLQPCYLYLFWTLLRTQQATRSDAWRYFLLCFSLPLLQLYGVLALPDAPLAFFTVVFLWTYVRYCRQATTANATWLAIAMAALVYSKYHGVLVIVFTLLSRPQLLRNWRTYYAGALAVALFLPHLWWQYAHDFASFRYHLVGRVGDGGFSLPNVAKYLLVAVGIANPFWATIYWRVRRKSVRFWGNGDPLRNALGCILWGFVGFFLLASLRGETQAQWLLPTVFPLLALLFSASNNPSGRRFVRRAGVVMAVLFLLVRGVVLFNPFHLEGQLWDNRERYGTIATMADGRPVLFTDDYTEASKYAFYTGKPAYGQSVFFSRESQWQYSDLDDEYFADGHTDAVIAACESPAWETIPLPGGGEFRYVRMEDYRPIRKVRVEPARPLCCRMAKGDSLRLTLNIYNPYPYDLCPTDSVPLLVTLFLRVSQHDQPESSCPLTDTLRAGLVTQVRCSFALAERLLPTTDDAQCGYPFGFSLRYPLYKSVLSSRRHELALTRCGDTITLVQQQ